jgi:hypothetical protein
MSDDDISNRISRPGTYDDLRGFLLDHAGHRVSVAIDTHKAWDGGPVFRARGILMPLTLADHEHDYQMIDEHMTEAGYDGYEDRDHIDELAWCVGHNADFKLVDPDGRETASMMVWDGEVRDVTVGLFGYISEHRGEEIAVTVEYADFCVEQLRWDYDNPDEDGCPGDLPSQLVQVRIERWVERPVAQALSEDGEP